MLSPLKPLELPPLPKSVIQKVLSPTTATPLLDQQKLLGSDPEPKSSSSTDDSIPIQARVHRSATLLDRHSRPEEQGKASVRRYKSTRELSSSTRHHHGATPESRLEHEAKLRVSEMPQTKLPPTLRASKSTGTRRAGTVSRGHEHFTEVPPAIRLEDRRPFEKGSLLGTEDLSAQSTQDDASALVKLEHEFQFAEGSLLKQATESVNTRGRSRSISRDPRMARSQSRSRHASGHDTKDQSSSSSRSKSLRRKPTLRDKELEAETQPPPLPVTTGEDGPLLQLDITPEASHTKALRSRQVKPLITF